MAGAGLSSSLRPERLAFAGELFDAAEAAAEEAGGFEDLEIEIAGLPLRLRFAGPALREVVGPAFSHLTCDARSKPEPDPELTVLLWDSESTGHAPPPPPWEHEDYREHGRIRGLFGDGVYATLLWGSSSLGILELGRARALYWRGDPRLPWFERAAPLRTMLHLWLSAEGRQFVHGAAVGTIDGAVLIAGPSGAGKSSTALACLGHPQLRLLADDYCVLEDGPDGPTLHGVYGTAKATAETIERLPELAPLVANPQRPNYDKAVLDLAGRAPGKLLRRAPLRAVLIPQLTGRAGSTLERVSGAAALAALAPSTILQLPGAGEVAMSRIAALATGVPTYKLRAGTDPARLTARIEELLGRETVV